MRHSNTGKEEGRSPVLLSFPLSLGRRSVDGGDDVGERASSATSSSISRPFSSSWPQKQLVFLDSSFR